MITPDEIKKKAGRKYAGYLRSVVAGEPFDRMVIRGNKSYTKSSLPDFEREIQLIYRGSKSHRGFGYAIEYQRVRTKTLGVQDLPVSIYFDTEIDFLKFLGKEEEVAHFKSDVERITGVFPGLKEWITANPMKVIRNQGRWNDLLKVGLFFQENPRPQKYIRELPVAVHTKFIERNKAIIGELLDVLIEDHIGHEAREFERRYNLKYNEAQIRFRILDPKIARDYFSGVDDLAIPLSQFEELSLPVTRVLLVENKTTLYTTLALPEMEGMIAIFGSGNGVLNLRNVDWFSRVELLYWGDIDAQGFEILSRFRGHFAHVESILMDEMTFDRFFEGDTGSPAGLAAPTRLTGPEQKLYDRLRDNNWRLEQEKIPHRWVVDYFEERGESGISGSFLK